MRIRWRLTLAGLCGAAACDSPVQNSTPTPTHTVGGVVSGLAGSGLVLVDNGSDTLTVSANGPVTFARALTEGASYRVTIRAQPTSPLQTCVVSGGSGTVATSDVTTVAVTCARGLVFASVSAGTTSTCGVTTAGDAYCWGGNDAGQLGDGTNTTSSTPVPVAGGLSFAAVSVGIGHSCGVTAEGGLYCWGAGYVWHTPDVGSTPTSVGGGLVFASVSVGAFHACAVTTAGAAYCWGDNSGGELGDGTMAGSPTPVAVAGGLTFAAVSAGTYSTCGVTTAGAAYCWGDNTLAGLGTGTATGPELCPSACSTVPAAVTGGLTFQQVNAEIYAACGLSTAGTAYCWGSNLDDDLGFGTQTGPDQCDWEGTTFACARTPLPVPGAPKLASLSGADTFTCGLTPGGAAYCWGYPQNLGDLAGDTAPAAVPGGLTFATLSAAPYSTCGVTTAGVAYCWGSNSNGELGDGTTTSSRVPVKVAGQP